MRRVQVVLGPWDLGISAMSYIAGETLQTRACRVAGVERETCLRDHRKRCNAYTRTIDHTYVVNEVVTPLHQKGDIAAMTLVCASEDRWSCRPRPVRCRWFRMKHVEEGDMENTFRGFFPTFGILVMRRIPGSSLVVRTNRNHSINRITVVDARVRWR